MHTDRTSDITTGTIAVQLDNTLRITIHRAVINSQTFRSIST